MRHPGPPPAATSNHKPMTNATAQARPQTARSSRRKGAQPLEAAKNPAALLEPATLRALTGLSASTLKRLQLRAKDPFPAPVQIGGTPRFPAGAVNEWLLAEAARAAATGTKG